MQKRPFRWASIVALTAVFGGSLAMVHPITHAQQAERSGEAQNVKPSRDPAQMAEQLTQKLDERLNLSDQQAGQVRGIIEEAARDLNEVRQQHDRRSPEARELREEILETAYGRVSELLNDEQRAELDRLRDEQIQKWEERREQKRQQRQREGGGR